jgi:hypothetical protein
MASETDLTIRILRDIQATQADHTRALAEVKGDIAVIKDKMVQHTLQLASQGGSLGEIANILQHLPDWIRQSPNDISRQLHTLEERIQALERGRQ